MTEETELDFKKINTGKPEKPAAHPIKKRKLLFEVLGAPDVDDLPISRKGYLQLLLSILIATGVIMAIIMIIVISLVQKYLTA